MPFGNTKNNPTTNRFFNQKTQSVSEKLAEKLMNGQQSSTVICPGEGDLGRPTGTIGPDNDDDFYNDDNALR